MDEAVDGAVASHTGGDLRIIEPEWSPVKGHFEVSVIPFAARRGGGITEHHG